MTTMGIQGWCEVTSSDSLAQSHIWHSTEMQSFKEAGNLSDGSRSCRCRAGGAVPMSTGYMAHWIEIVLGRIPTVGLALDPQTGMGSIGSVGARRWRCSHPPTWVLGWVQTRDGSREGAGRQGWDRAATAGGSCRAAEKPFGFNPRVPLRQGQGLCCRVGERRASPVL